MSGYVYYILISGYYKKDTIYRKLYSCKYKAYKDRCYILIKDMKLGNNVV